MKILLTALMLVVMMARVDARVVLWAAVWTCGRVTANHESDFPSVAAG